jgi:predicted nuclease with TOPRIM domain
MHRIRLSLSTLHCQRLMSDTSEKIALLQKDLQQALNAFQQLKKSLQQEREKHQHLLVEKQKLETEVNQLQEQVKTIKLAQAIQQPNDQSGHELKLQINRYLREIDKCLNLINND